MVARRKYHNKKIEHEGYIFDSIKERDRYITLQMLVDDGLIDSLEIQPKFKLKAKYDCGRELYYKADFGYQDLQTMEMVYEDVKGFETQEFKIKKALVKLFYDVDIKVVK